jgi:hypothetical protein
MPVQGLMVDLEVFPEDCSAVGDFALRLPDWDEYLVVPFKQLWWDSQLIGLGDVAVEFESDFDVSAGSFDDANLVGFAVHAIQ